MRRFHRSWILIAPLVAAAAIGLVGAGTPELTTWTLNTTGLTGYGGLPANVQLVRYSANYVYVSSSGIPSYTIGPWPSDPNVPSNQGYVFKIPRIPAVNAGTKTSTPLGAMAVWTNGVAAYNPLDAHSYNNQNIWHQNAILVEGASFDACLGHPAPGGRYHNHQNARCVYTANAATHSPILGWSFDGYPIYGPYAFTNTDGSGGIARMRSSYRLRNITTRTSLPDGTVLTAPQYGPAVSVTFPLGYYVEDFEFVSGLGDLDAYNGRFAVTPEYPLGTYAYFVTIDATGASAYPYAIGPKYNGVVATENMTTMGHVVVSEAVTTYTAAPAPGVVANSLLLGKSGIDGLVLSWGPSCGSGAVDYGIFEGTLLSWYSHAAVACHDVSGDLTETITSSPGDRYYFVVPLGISDEGSFGAGTSGVERPRGSSYCDSSQLLASCP